MRLTKRRLNQIILEEYTKLLNEKRGPPLTRRALDYVKAKIAANNRNVPDEEILRIALLWMDGWREKGDILPDGDLSNEILNMLLSRPRGSHIDRQLALKSMGKWPEKCMQDPECDLEAELKSLWAPDEYTIPERYWRSRYGLRRLFNRMATGKVTANCPCVGSPFSGVASGLGLSGGKTIRIKGRQLPMGCIEDCVEEEIQAIIRGVKTDPGAYPAKPPPKKVPRSRPKPKIKGTIQTATGPAGGAVDWDPIPIKEELLNIQINTTISKEDPLSGFIKEKYLKPANKICKTMSRSFHDPKEGRRLFLEIVNAIVDNPGEYEDIIYKMYPEHGIWLRQQIDEIAPLGWTFALARLSNRQKRNIKRNVPDYITC